MKRLFKERFFVCGMLFAQFRERRSLPTFVERVAPAKSGGYEEKGLVTTSTDSSYKNRA